MSPPTGGAHPRAHGISSARSPWTDSRFGLLQLTVLALALVRLAVTVAFGLDVGNAVLEVSTVALFAVPVVIASLNFGMTGGLATVAWVAALDIPRMVDAADHGLVPALWSEVIQLLVLLGLALLVGSRVTAETRFREQADAARTARFEAEALYQDMFESNRSPILVVDGDGRVVGANNAAAQAFAMAPDSVLPIVTGGPGTGDGRRLVDVVGPDAAALVLTRLLDDGRGVDPGPREARDGPVGPGPVRMAAGHVDDGSRPLTFEVDGRRVLYRPTSTLVGAPGPHRRMQVIFEDVTTETRRHDLMEAYAGQVVLGQEEERRHIAQELHDGPLQALIHICRQIDALEGAPDGSGATDGRDGGMLATMRSSVEDTVAELRSIARGLRPSVLDDLGLVASINQILTEATEREGFQSLFTVDGTVTRLSPAVELAVFRIAQEAVTNVGRHARASQVDVVLQFGEGWLGLSVTDDGAGFDPESEFWGDTQSLGLPGMSERARLIGGRLTVTSQAGRGTTVQVRVPLSFANAH